MVSIKCIKAPPPPPPWLRLLSVLRQWFCCCWLFCLLLLPLWKSIIVLCFVVSNFMSILVMQSSWWGRESWFLCLVCRPGVWWWLCGSPSRCHGFVSGLWLMYFWSKSLFLWLGSGLCIRDLCQIEKGNLSEGDKVWRVWWQPMLDLQGRVRIRLG